MGAVKPHIQCNHHQRIANLQGFPTSREEFIYGVWSYLLSSFGEGTWTIGIACASDLLVEARMISQKPLNAQATCATNLCRHGSECCILQHASSIYILLPRAPTQQRCSKLSVECAVALKCRLLAQEMM